ncbi:hypothetical protein SLS62_004359 [Diatrype stigma]|uniref:Uncharacterized protein n=1 Tax=Diatrype stigma TaxID=117547 RepID=A0AAN9URJ8_9PEZI
MTNLLAALIGILNIPLALAQIRHHYNSNPLLDRLISRGGEGTKKEEIGLNGRRQQEESPITTITATTIITITTNPTSPASPVILGRNSNSNSNSEDDASACESAYQSLVDTIPTPTRGAGAGDSSGSNAASSLLAALSPFLATADVADPTVYCAVVTNLPDRQLRHDYRAWNDAMESWCEDHGDALTSLAGACVGGEGEGGLPSWATVDCEALSRYVYRGCTGAAPVTLASGDGEGMGGGWGARGAAAAATPTEG